ncbi:MAG: nucleotide exchange factor GrpE [Chloroflexi bacterium]|nr:nucleotide exchange factor GrpE [Chloroflexota bacterium]
MTDEEARNEGASLEAAPEALPDDMEELRRLVAEERGRVEEHRSQLLRARADYANLKRRTDQEKGDAVRFGNAMLILNLLPILDDFERALDNVSAKLAGFTWVDGVAMIYRKYKAALEANGLSEIKAVGERFDPSVHEAIQFTEGDEGKVVEEVQKGYKLFDRVIRPALVKVGGKPPEAAPGPTGQPAGAQKEENDA